MIMFTISLSDDMTVVVIKHTFESELCTQVMIVIVKVTALLIDFQNTR